MEKKRNSLLYMFILSTTVLLIVSAITALVMIQATNRVEEIAMDERYNVVLASSKFISAEMLDKFNSIEDMYSLDYYETKRKLINFSEANDYKYVYYLQYDPNTDTLQYIGGNNYLDFEVYNNENGYELWEESLTDVLNSDNKEIKDAIKGFHTPPIELTDDARDAINGVINIDNLGSFEEDGHFLETAWAPIFYKDGSPSKYVTNVAIYEDYLHEEQAKSRIYTIVFILSIFGAIASCAVNLKLYNDKVKSYKDANQAKSDFLSKMSHEIRTPMNAIIGMTKIAGKSENKEKMKYCLNTIESSSSQLLQLINDVLDISKIEAGNFDLESKVENIEKIMMRSCNLFIEQMEAKNIKLDVEFDENMSMHYYTDALRLTQVINNLFSNAIKFTPENGRISVTIAEVLRENDISTIRFKVSDSGIGMTAEQTKRMFVKYEQAEASTAKKYGGTGLGLVICKTIVEKMGGQIWVESEVGIGSTFIFDIKLKREETKTGKSFFNNLKPDDIKFLVVEADEKLKKHVVKIVKGFGIHPETATTSSECIEVVTSSTRKHEPFDVVVIDYDLPDMNGLDTIKALDGVIDNNTVVVMTTFNTWGKLTDKAINVGVDKFVTKPCFPSSLFDAINEALIKSRENINITKAKMIDEIPNLEHFKILLAEDIEINQIIFTSLLAETKIQIDIANNGREAVEMFEEKASEYDLIVMDIQMPEMDGLKATRRIRSSANPKGKRIPIIAMTANAFKEDVEDCLEAGMNDHLAKPIDDKLLISTIVRYTQQSFLIDKGV